MADHARLLLTALADRTPVEMPVALVVAHPDDESIGTGGSVHLLRNLLLVHVTDGAPRNGADAASHGFRSPDDYAAARQAELRSALQVAGCAPAQASLGVADQQASLQMPHLAETLSRLLERHGTRCVITHPYEGGHPDHDATALIVRLAVSRMADPPGIVEMTSYHAGPHGWVTGQFLPGPAVTEVRLMPSEQERKRAMFACHRTQAQVLASFGTEMEAFRVAPNYDFSQAPHDGALNYEGFGWDWTGPRWRALAAAAMESMRCAA